MWSLRVGQTWAGEPLPDEQQARVRLSMTSEGLGIHIDSPWYDDPVPTGPPGLLNGHRSTRWWRCSSRRPLVPSAH